jgi:hypothetical protein
MAERLPTFEVEDKAAVLEAFGGEDGYRQWLRAMVADRVDKYRRVVVEREVNAFREEQLKKRPHPGPVIDPIGPPLPEVPGSTQPVPPPEVGARR